MAEHDGATPFVTLSWAQGLDGSMAHAVARIGIVMCNSLRKNEICMKFATSILMRT